MVLETSAGRPRTVLAAALAPGDGWVGRASVDQMVGRRRLQLGGGRVDPRADRDPDGIALIWEGEDGDVRPHAQRRAGASGPRGLRGCCAAWVSARVTASASTCRSCRKRSSRCSPWVESGAIFTPIFSGYGAPAVASRLADCGATAAHHRGRALPARLGGAAQAGRGRGGRDGAERRAAAGRPRLGERLGGVARGTAAGTPGGTRRWQTRQSYRVTRPRPRPTPSRPA